MISFPCHNYSFVIQQTLASQSHLLIKVQASSVPLVHSHAWSSTSISVSMSKMGWRSLNLIVKYALYGAARHKAPMACSSRTSADCASITSASSISSETFVLEGHCVDRGVSVARYFSLDLSWKYHISSTSGRGWLGMLCIAVCVLNETCEIFWNSRANVKSDRALKRSVAAASSAVSEPDSLEISPVTFMPFDGTESPGRGTSTRILSG